MEPFLGKKNNENKIQKYEQNQYGKRNDHKIRERRDFEKGFLYSTLYSGTTHNFL